MKNVSNILCSVIHFSNNRASCPLRYVEKYGTARQDTNYNVTWCMRFACWITKATDTQSEYVILIACPQQQKLHERASMLRL
jgi:hypothetical protein